MAAKIILAFCVQALLIQSAFSQCAAGIAGPRSIPGPVGYNGLSGPALAGSYGAGCGGIVVSGGGFPVTSISPIAPTGLTIISENTIEGPLNVGGNLPFLSTVVLEGVLPTAGAGAVSYGCGNSGVGIVSEGPIATGIIGPAAFGPVGPAGYGPAASYGIGPGLIGAPVYNGLAGCGCGCGAAY